MFLIINYHIMEWAIQYPRGFIYFFFHMGDLNLNSGYGYKLKQILKFQCHFTLYSQQKLD